MYAAERLRRPGAQSTSERLDTESVYPRERFVPAHYGRDISRSRDSRDKKIPVINRPAPLLQIVQNFSRREMPLCQEASCRSRQAISWFHPFFQVSRGPTIARRRLSTLKAPPLPLAASAQPNDRTLTPSEKVDEKIGIGYYLGFHFSQASLISPKTVSTSASSRSAQAPA